MHRQHLDTRVAKAITEQPLKHKLADGALHEQKDAPERDKLAAAAGDLNQKEGTTHSASQIFKNMMHRWEAAARGLASVTVVLDENWRVVRAHIRTSQGSKLASQLLDDSSGWFSLNDLNMTRNVSWEPVELALCEARLDPDGRIRQLNRNAKAAEHFDEFEKKLRTEGLPHTKVLTGD